MTSSLLFFGTLTGFGRYSLDSKLRHSSLLIAFMIFIFDHAYRRPYNAVVRYAITPPMIITLHLKFNCIKFVGPADVRSLTHRQAG